MIREQLKGYLIGLDRVREIAGSLPRHRQEVPPDTVFLVPLQRLDGPLAAADEVFAIERLDGPLQKRLDGQRLQFVDGFVESGQRILVGRLTHVADGHLGRRRGR